MRLTAFHEDMKHRFPVLYRNCYAGCDVGKGWRDIVAAASSKLFLIEPLYSGHLGGEDLAVVQVKEKFGGLCIYTNFHTPEVDATIKEAVIAASKTCERCGEPGELRTNRSWHKTLCEECNNKR